MIPKIAQELQAQTSQQEGLGSGVANILSDSAIITAVGSVSTIGKRGEAVIIAVGTSPFVVIPSS